MQQCPRFRDLLKLIQKSILDKIFMEISTRLPLRDYLQLLEREYFESL